jgi:hypothetical protein
MPAPPARLRHVPPLRTVQSTDCTDSRGSGPARPNGFGADLCGKRAGGMRRQVQGRAPSRVAPGLVPPGAAACGPKLMCAPVPKAAAPPPIKGPLRPSAVASQHTGPDCPKVIGKGRDDRPAGCSSAQPEYPGERAMTGQPIPDAQKFFQPPLTLCGKPGKARSACPLQTGAARARLRRSERPWRCALPRCRSGVP